MLNVFIKKEQESQNLKKTYQCDMCGMQFENFRSLGGHCSNSHPGMSETFNKKKKVREERAIDREALKKA